MARKKKFDYFEAFVQIGDYAVQYAEKLVEFLEGNYERGQRGEDPNEEIGIAAYDAMHKIEEASDEIVHQVATNLVSEFMTPIDREDIMELVDELDTVVDNLDEIIQRMYMYNVHFVSYEVVEMSHVMLKSMKAMQEACARFEHYKKSEHLREYIIKINDYEDEADRLYIRSMHDIHARVYQSEYTHSLEAFAMGRVLTSIEKVCDGSEAVANTMRTVIMKNC